MVTHPIEPIFDENSKILILGSFPSQKSRTQKFFYGHPQNRFWQVTSGVLGKKTPETVEEKRIFLLSSRIAVWDVIASCDVEGSADSSIKNVVPNDISKILSVSNIEKIFVNGKAAEKYYNMYIKTSIGREAIYLPSTSAANASWPLEKLISAWSIINCNDAL